MEELHHAEEIDLDIQHKQAQILAELQAIREALDIPPQSPIPTRPPTRPPTVVITTPRPSSYQAADGCGNGSCEMDETNKSCPNDCVGAQLDTTSYDQSMASSAESIKFAIMAKRAVAIKSLSFYTSTSARNSEVTVKTLEGQYSQGIFSDWTTDEWKTVFHGPVFTRRYDSEGAQLTNVEFDQDVVVPTGKIQSFEVHTASSHIMVQLGEQEGMLAGQDTALEVRVGESGAQSSAAFRGIITYDGLDDSSNTGGRAKSAKAKAAKLEKDDAVLDTVTNTLSSQADNDEGEEEAVESDLILQVDVTSLDDKMGALEENVQSIKADAKATNDKMEALEEDVQSIKSMMTHIVKLLEASGDVEEEAEDGTTN